MRNRPTQREIILNLLREHPERWFFSYELMKANTKWGWIGSQGDRRARELAEEGIIQVRHNNKYAEYCANPPIKVTEYRDPTTKELRHREVIYK